MGVDVGPKTLTKVKDKQLPSHRSNYIPSILRLQQLRLNLFKSSMNTGVLSSLLGKFLDFAQKTLLCL